VAESSSVAENARVKDSELADTEASEMSDSVNVPLTENERRPAVDSHDAADTKSTLTVEQVAIPVAESDSQSQDTIADSQPEPVAHHVPHASQDSVTAVETAEIFDESFNLTASSPVIDIADEDDADADVVLVDEAEVADSKTMKESVVSAWQGQDGGAMRSVVERALAQVSASHDSNSPSPNPVISDVVQLPSSSSHATTVPPKPVASRATPLTNTGSQSQASRRRMIGHGINTTATQSDVPTARVVGRIISMRGSSPQVTTTAQRASTTVTQCTNVIASSTPSLTTTSVAPAAHMAHSAALANYPNVSSAANNRSLAAGRGTSSTRRPGVRRAPRSRRMALLRPEDLYEISSQIVAEVLQRNRQPAKLDVITCNDDDAVDTANHSQSPSSCDDVVFIDEPAVTSSQASATQHSRTQRTASSAGTKASARKKLILEPASSKTGASAGTSSRKKLCIPPPSSHSLSAPSRRPVDASSTLHDLRVVEADEGDDVVCCDEDSRDSTQHGTVERTSANLVATNMVTDDTDDVVCCDEESEDPVQSGTLKRTVASPGRNNTVSDGDVVYCDEEPEESIPGGNLERTAAIPLQTTTVTDDVVFCDEDFDDPVPDGTAERTSTRPVATTRVAASVNGNDDDVVICDTPGPVNTDAIPSTTRRNFYSNSMPVISAGSVTGSRRHGGSVPSATVTANRLSNPAASISATSSGRDVSTADEVVLVDADIPSSTSNETTQGASQSSDSSVIVLD